MNKNFSVAIIGGGPAGVMCAVWAAKNKNNRIYIIDPKELLSTILPTGGGRCNLGNYLTDNRQLAANYPRGEKFLYSPFEKFATKDTIKFFESLGLKLKVEKDNRIFPKSDSSKDVQKILTDLVKSSSNIEIIKNRVLKLQKKGQTFLIEMFNDTLSVDAVVLATGGNSSGYKLASGLGHNIISPTPSLCPLKIKEKQFCTIPGTNVENARISVVWNNRIIKKMIGDLLFTHSSVSGPIILEISSLFANLEFSTETPLKLIVNFTDKEKEDFAKIFEKEIKNNPKKNIINICGKFVSKHIANLFLEEAQISPSVNVAEVPRLKIKMLANMFTDYTFNVVSRESATAKVTAGGIFLNEIESKTMQSKKVQNLFFCGEIMDIDGLCGGFNLQNCWTTGYIAGMTLSKVKVL